MLEEVELAEGYVKEAEKCKLLLSSLHETTAQREEPTPMNRFLQYSQGQSETFQKRFCTLKRFSCSTNCIITSLPVCSYLATLCESLQEFLTQHLATSVNSMLATAQVNLDI